MKFILFFILLTLCPAMIFAKELNFAIRENWQFRQVNKNEWLPAEVPGTVHTDLLKNGKIQDPFYRDNEKNQLWIEGEDWEYKTIFNATSEIISKDKIILDFLGLDTYADIYVNDSLILQADNMFRSWQVDVSNIIHRGENELRIYFHSPIKITEPIYDNLGYTLPVSSNDQSDKKLSVFTRKAPYHYGWDWGPRFVTSGIWKPIMLRAWDTAIINEAFMEQKSLESNKASLLAYLDFEITRPFFGEIEVLVDGKSVKKSTVDLKYGRQQGNVSFSINDPELWWPNGLGKQKLYAIEILLKKEDQVIHAKRFRTGLRTIELVQEDDRHGTSFYFKVNGKPVFMKGANYIPQDNFLPRVTADRYNHILQSAVDANMNMIRVWGGGIYEKEIFYELCDEKGLLIWQDFMFSCAMYPGDKAFLDNIEKEATEQVKRLRNHPSMALWCGNNEILLKWKDWQNNANEEGKQAPLWKNKSDSMKIVLAYENIFKDTIPHAVRNYGLGIPYWESSPSAPGGKFDDWKSGDSHYWGVWWGQEPFKAFRQNIGRFMSEYGFQSFPEFKTVKSFTNESDRDIYSEVMRSHQRSSIGNETIASYLAQYFNEPKDFASYLYISQLLQAEGVKVAMEAHRIRKPGTMGSLVWQLNDCWPVASWSSIDYFGRWKALHYYAKRAFKENLVAFEPEGETIKVHAITDSYDELKGNLIIELMDLNGKSLLKDEKKIKVKPNSSEEVWKKTTKELLKKQQKNTVCLRARLFVDENLITENVYFFVPYKDLKLDPPNIKYDFIEDSGKLLVQLKSNKTAFGVCFESRDLDLEYSDNYFILYPGETKSVEIKGDIPVFEIKNKLAVKSLVDNYAP